MNGFFAFTPLFCVIVLTSVFVILDILKDRNHPSRVVQRSKKFIERYKKHMWWVFSLSITITWIFGEICLMLSGGKDRDSTKDTDGTEHNTETLRTGENIYTTEKIYTDNSGEKRKKDRLRVWNLSGILQRPQTVKTNVDFTEYKTFSQHPPFPHIYFPPSFPYTYIFPDKKEYPEVNCTLSSEVECPVYFNLWDIVFFSKKKKKSTVQTGLWGWG